MLRLPWITLQDRVDRCNYELALKQLVDREQRLDDVRRYLLPMMSWGLDTHTKGHIEMMLHLSDFRKSE